MKLVKSLLLGSAAGLVAVAGASAADLGVKKPTAVEYVKTCPTYGAGFFVVPGTTSCLKLIGRIRADYIVLNPLTRGANANRWRSRAYVGFDHRTATEYGLLRTYARAFFQFDNNGGARHGGAGDATVLEYAFIQFGGLTFGRITPVVEHGWSQFYHYSGQGSYGYHADASYVNSIGYTFNAGGGFSATVALDDGHTRLAAIGGGVTMGRRMPDIVGSLDYTQSWGSFKLAGAIHQVGAVGTAAGVPSTKYGYSILAAAKINLDMLGKGSNFWVSGSFGEGSSNYQGFNADSFTIGGRQANVTDATLVGNSLKLTKSYAIMGALQVFVMPTVSISLGATYAQLDPFGGANQVRTWSALGQVAWNPVPGFLIGVEGVYRNISHGAGANVVNANNTGVLANQKRNDFTGRLRVQRDF